MLKRIWLLQLFLVVGAFIGLQFLKPLSFNTDISQLFPSDSANENIHLVLEQFARQSQNNNLILIGHTDFALAKQEALHLQQKLAELAAINQVQVQFPSLMSMEALVAFFSPYRHLLLSWDYQAALASGSDEALFKLQFAELNQMANPLIASTLPIDPSLSLANYLSTRQLASSLKQDDGFLYAKEGELYYLLLHFTTQASGMSLTDSAVMVQKIDQFESQLESQLVKFGTLFFADFAGTNAKQEMTLFSVISIVGMSLLVILAYRSVGALVVTLSVTGLSLFYGYVALNLLFEQVHILTFVFSITLVGVSCDYCFHALTELHSNRTQCLKAIRLPLFMGFISTAVGYLVLIFSPVQVFFQIAIFTIAGLSISIFTVLALFPALPIGGNKPLKTSHRLLFRLQQAYCTPKLAMAVAVGLLILLVGFVSQLQLNDDVRKFYQVSDELKASEIMVKRLLNNQAEPQFILVPGKTADEVLTRELLLTERLTQLKLQGVLTDFRAISQWLPPVAVQRSNQHLMQKAMAKQQFEALAQILGPMDWQLNQRNDYLGVDEWLSSNLGQQHKGQWYALSDHYFSVVKLLDIKDLPVLTQAIEAMPELLLVDRATEVSLQLSEFRTQLMLFLAGSFVLLLLVLSVVYDVKRAAAILGVTLSAVLIALAVTLLLNQELNIFNFMAVVIIVALGLDYSIFYADHGLIGQVSFTTMISALSSMFVFAVLVLSQTPAIHNFGLTVFIGILATYLLSPFVALARVNPVSLP